MSGTAAAPSDLLSRSEVRRRASAGVFVTAAFGFLNLLCGFGGNIVLARLLVPRDFGLVAIGATLTLFATALCEGGLGSGLIRRPETPTRRELSTVLGLQLVITTALALGIAAVALRFGRPGQIAAVMLVALPLSALQTPGRVTLARTMLYRRLSVVDATALVAYYAWAIAGVAAGFGVWALASAAVVRALAAALALAAVSRLGIVRPSLRGTRALWPLMAFGIRFQGVSLTMVVRDQGLNAATGAIAGVATLGLWAFINRLMQVPLLFFESLWRVSFPAMSQLLAAEEDPKPAIERGVALSATASGLLLAAFAAASPELVPAVFGEPWRAAATVVPWACLALLLSGPISVATVGYLYAAGSPTPVLRASFAYAAVWLAVSLPLLPVLGVQALGIGWLAGSLADAAVLGRAAHRLSGASPVRPLLVPAAVAGFAGAAGWAVCVAGPTGLVTAVAAAAVALGLTAAGLLVLRRALLVATATAALGSLRAALSRSRTAPATGEAALP